MPAAANAGGAGSPDDLELLHQVASGDGAAFGLLAERHGPRLRSVLLRLGLNADEAEEALQETLIRIWRGSARFQDRSSVSTWAYRIALNQGIDLRRRAARRRWLWPEPVDGDHEPEESWERRVEAAAVRDAVVRLPPRLRLVVVLREYEDLSYQAIGETLRIPIGTVMSRLHAARKLLRKELAPLLRP